MKKLFLPILVIALLSFIACKDATQESDTADAETEETMDKAAEEAPDYAAFNASADVIRAFFAAHGAEDLEKMTAMLEDTLEYSPPAYNGNKPLGKTEFLEAIKGYHDNFENIKFNEGIVTKDGVLPGMWSGSVYPEETATNKADALRVYGTWTATHTETQKETGTKYYSIIGVNENGKIATVSSYFDVNGLAAQLAAEEE